MWVWRKSALGRADKVPKVSRSRRESSCLKRIRLLYLISSVARQLVARELTRSPSLHFTMLSHAAAPLPSPYTFAADFRWADLLLFPNHRRFFDLL